MQHITESDRSGDREIARIAVIACHRRDRKNRETFAADPRRAGTGLRRKTQVRIKGHVEESAAPLPVSRAKRGCVLDEWSLALVTSLELEDGKAAWHTSRN